MHWRRAMELSQRTMAHTRTARLAELTTYGYTTFHPQHGTECHGPAAAAATRSGSCSLFELALCLLAS
jgi:hypothetical protein